MAVENMLRILHGQPPHAPANTLEPQPQSLEDALAVHLAKRITEQLQACAIGVTEVE